MHLPVRNILVTLVSLFTISLALGAMGVFASPLGDLLSQLTGIKESTIKELVDPVTGKIPLRLLPTGPGSGLDAETLGGQPGSFYARQSDFKAFQEDTAARLAQTPGTVGPVDFSPYLTKTGQASDSAKLGGNLPSFYQNATNLTSGTLADTRLSANVALLNSAQTFSGAKTFSALLSASAGFSLTAGTLTLPATSVADSALSANIALLTGSQTFTGSKTFSSAISAPTSANTINGLVINAGALSGITTLSLSGAITGATSINTINGLVFSSGNATLANLTSSSGALTSTVADGATAVGFVLGTSTSYVTAGAKLLSLKNNTVEEFAIDKDGNLTVNGNIVATGTIQGTQLISTVATGTAPLAVSSTTQVANLNASLLGGKAITDIQANVQLFTASGTWTKPTGAKWVRVIVAGAGGGGGGGVGAGAGTNRGGGSAGGGGACIVRDFHPDALGATESVTVGAAGTGGASSGVNGVAGGNSTFGTLVTAYAGGYGAGGGANSLGGGGGGGHSSIGGNGGGGSGGLGGGPEPAGSTKNRVSFGGGSGGRTGEGNAQSGGNAVWGGGGGGDARDINLPLVPGAGGGSLYGAGGGGGAGGVTTSNVASTGEAGGTNGAYATGGGGAAGTTTEGSSGTAGASRSGTGNCGDGGGGGTGNSAGTGGAGGAGGAPGGGGGGGGGGTTTGGVGGAGGRGEVIITTWF